MKEGDIVLTSMPQADGKVKNRPAIYLREMPPLSRYPGLHQGYSPTNNL